MKRGVNRVWHFVKKQNRSEKSNPEIERDGLMARFPMNSIIAYQLKHTTRLRSDIITPNVIDITGLIKGDTNMAADMLSPLFSIRPRAANELSNENEYFLFLLSIQRKNR